MRVLIACESSATVRDAFTRAGHTTYSCDLLPTESPGLHFQGDVRLLLDGWQPVMYTADCDPDGDGWCAVTDTDPADCGCFGPTQDGIEYREVDGVLFGRPKHAPHWDLLIAHPPCTYISVSGMHWTTRGKRDPQLTEDALAFVQLLLDAPVPHIAIENPVSIISTKIRKPDQTIQPYQFGHDASKRTCLWLKNLPKLRPTGFIEPRVVDGKDRWANQTDSGQNRLTPSPDRWKARSETYAGIADAMADQWGEFVSERMDP